ncbi:MAG: hypothetical protein V3V49_01035 [Candidatus Krumholzibacteria bacterium]
MKRYSASAGRNSIPPKKLRVGLCGLGCLRNNLLALLGCALVAGTTTAQTLDGTISLYSDSLFTTSEASDTAPGILTVYVVHDKMTTGHVSVEFMVSGGGGFTGTWLDETVQQPVFVGSSPNGIRIAYNFCLSPPNHVLTIRYFLSGTSATNSYLQVLPHPEEPTQQIIVQDCSFWLSPAAGGTLRVNPSVVPTEATTWGRIKALYR